jgi:hypothetical protein
MSLASSSSQPNGHVTGEPPSTPPSRQNSLAQMQNGHPPPSPPPEDTELNIHSIKHTRSHPIKPPRGHEHEASGPQSRIHARIRTYTDDERKRLYPRLSKPLELMHSSYDVLVIGSGYGGAVAASNMARSKTSTGKRKTVCVLERGQEKWPGEYPSGVADAFKQLHVSGEFAPAFLPGHAVDSGDPTGMYHLIFGKGLNAVVCNGELT